MARVHGPGLYSTISYIVSRKLALRVRVSPSRLLTELRVLVISCLLVKMKTDIIMYRLPFVEQ